MMTGHDDLMTGAVADLKQALADNECSCVHGGPGHLAHALACVERALGQRIGDVSTGAEDLSDQDRALLPSPGVERRTEGLRHELDRLLREIRALRADVIAGRCDPGGSLQGGFQDRIQTLVTELNRHEHDEIELVQESITPDIGAGD